MKLAISGGGPISSDIQNFIRVAMKFNLVQGYGLTETCSGGTLQHSDSVADGVAGAPLACLKMRLKDCNQTVPAAPPSDAPWPQVCFDCFN